MGSRCRIVLFCLTTSSAFQLPKLFHRSFHIAPHTLTDVHKSGGQAVIEMLKLKISDNTSPKEIEWAEVSGSLDTIYGMVMNMNADEIVGTAELLLALQERFVHKPNQLYMLMSILSSRALDTINSFQGTQTVQLIQSLLAFGILDHPIWGPLQQTLVSQAVSQQLPPDQLAQAALILVKCGKATPALLQSAQEYFSYSDKCCMVSPEVAGELLSVFAQQHLITQQLLSALLGQIVHHKAVHRISSSAMPDIVASFTTLELYDATLLDALLEYLDGQRTLETFPLETLLHLKAACQYAGVHHEPLQQCIDLKTSHMTLGDLQPAAFVSLLSTCAQLQIHIEPLVSFLMMHAMKPDVLQGCTATEVAAIAWAFSKLGAPATLAQLLSSHLVGTIKLDVQQTVEVAEFFARFDVHNDSLISALFTSLRQERSLALLSNENLVQVLRLLCQPGWGNGQAFNKVCHHIVGSKRVKQFTDQEIAQITWAVAYLGGEDAGLKLALAEETRKRRSQSHRTPSDTISTTAALVSAFSGFVLEDQRMNTLHCPEILDTAS